MKPCVCQGSNSSCRWCHGSGYVADGVGLPQKPSEVAKWMPESESVRSPAGAKQPAQLKPRPSPRRETVRDLWWGFLLPIVLYFLLRLFLG